MNMRRGFKLTLMIMVLSACGSFSALSQTTPAKNSSRGSYYVKLTATPGTTQEQMTARKHTVLHSAAYWDNLYNVGKVTIVGAAKDGETSFGLVILEGVSKAEAVSIANGDPSVKAGVTNVEVLPMQVFQAKESTRPKASH